MNKEQLYDLITFGDETFSIDFVFPDNGFELYIRNLTKDRLVAKLKFNNNPETMDEKLYSMVEDLESINSYTELMDWLLEVSHIEDNNILALLKNYGKY